MGDTLKAVEYFDQAVIIDRKVGVRFSERTSLGNLGVALYHLGDVEKLINECGYHRRDEELADAKRAILGH